nr:hypothetical protein [Acidobacteriota bacterium]
LAVPWLPGTLPSIALLWTGRMAWLIWLAVALCMVASKEHRLLRVTRPQITAGALAFTVGAIAFWQVAPSVPGGDEPHYLVITQSLLKDGDIRIENNHRQGDYRAYVSGDLKPDFRVRGRNGEIYSIHAPGVSALVAPAFAIAGYGGVVVFLLLLSAAGSALTWHLAWFVSKREDAAWFGWAAVTLSATWIFHSFTVYPDGPGAVLTLTGVWALLRAEREATSTEESMVPWLLHGAALAALPWMHTRFAAIAGLTGALVLLRLPRVPNAAGKALAFLCIPAVSALGWIGYFIKIYGTPDPSVPYGGEPNSLAFIPDGLAGLLFDQRFGLLPYAPVLLCAAAGICVMAVRSRLRRYALELLFVVGPYLLVVSYVAMWWGGRSAPARFFVPVLPWMAIPAAVGWTAVSSRGARALALAALAFTAFASASLVLVGDGHLAYNSRLAYANWLEWLNGSLDLGRGLPAWWREDEAPLFRGIAIWGSAAVAGYFVVRSLIRVGRLQNRGAFAAASALVAAVFAMVSITVSWAASGVGGRAAVPAQLDALRRLSTEPRLLAFDLNAFTRLRRSAVASALHIEPSFSSSDGGAGRNDRPLFVIPAVPAGEYRLRFARRSAGGWLMVGIGRDQFALRTGPLDSGGAPMSLTFPVDVRAIVVRGDEEARRNVQGVTIEPARILHPGERLSKDFARRAVRYAAATAFFMDDRSFPEPEAFWVGGARDSVVVLQPDQPRATITLLLRNGPVENRVMVEAGSWRDAARLGPGEERQIDVPLDRARGATRLRFTTSAGFRPSTADPKSRDDRFLGVWIKVTT